jgi:hypothetical protein
MPSDDLRDLWQSQSTGTFQMSTAEIQARIEKLATTARVRNRGGILVTSFVILNFIWWLTFIDTTLSRVGAVMTIAGVVYMLYQVLAHRNGERAASQRAAESGTSSIDFHRAQLARQRDFHRGRTLALRLLFFAPGPLVFFAGMARERAKLAWMFEVEGITFAILLIIAIPLNLSLARKYQRRLDELDALQKEQS